MSLDLLFPNFETLIRTPEDVARLNEAILGLAVQGKLVSQDPADEPASELLKRIRVNYSNAQHQKTRTYEQPPPSDEAPSNELPDTWASCRLVDLAEVIRGVSYEKSQAQSTPDDDYLPILRANNINGELNFEDLVYVPAYLIAAEQRLREHDIAVCMSSGSASLVGKSAMLRIPFEGSFGAFCAVLRSRSKDLAPYLDLYMSSPTCRHFLTQTSRGIGINNLRVSDLLGTPFPLPPLAEQRRIVAKVESLFVQTRALEAKLRQAQADIVTVNRAALNRLSVAADDDAFAAAWATVRDAFDLLYDDPRNVAELRQAILQLAVQGKLVPQDPADEPASELLKRIRAEKRRLVKEGKIEDEHALPPVKQDEMSFRLPQGWVWVRLGSAVLALQTGPFGSMLHKSDYVERGIPVVNPANIQDGRIRVLPEMIISESTRDRLRRYVLEQGDIVMGRRGEMGRCALVTTTEAGWLCGSGSFVLKTSVDLDQEFLIKVIRSPETRGYLTGGSVGSTMNNLNHRILNNLVIGLPPLAEQHRIVAKVDQLMQQCDALEAGLARAAGQRRALTAAALHGAFNPAR